jgi:hypothetical protein
MQGPFFVSSKGHDAVYVHTECAVWSPKVRRPWHSQKHYTVNQTYITTYLSSSVLLYLSST